VGDTGSSLANFCVRSVRVLARLAHRGTRPTTARLGQGNITEMALENHLFPNVNASRNASELHPLDTSWAKGTMIRGVMVLGHVLILDDSLANL